MRPPDQKVADTVADLLELLDISQAAELLQVSETSLRRWTNEGRLACLRVGRRRERRFRKADLIAFMEAQPADMRTAPAPPAETRQHTVIDGLPISFGTHLCSLYDSDDRRAQQACAFLTSGLRAGTVSLLMSTPEVAETIRSSLRPECAWLDEMAAEGTFLATDYASTVSEQLAKVEETLSTAIRTGARAIRVVGDVWAFYAKVGADAIVAYETGYDRRITHRFPTVTLCMYDVRRFSTTEAMHALQGHHDSFAYPPDRWLG